MPFDIRDLTNFQADFLAALNATEIPESPALAVYHATCLYGRIDVLSATYKMTLKALGGDAFKAFARDFVRDHMATSGNMTTYGASFGDFLNHHPHSPDWLPDLVRFEWALHQAHHAKDATPCDFSDLLEPANPIALHPSVQILATGFDTATLYTAVRDDAPLPETGAKPHVWLIGRTPMDDVIWQSITPYEADFISRIAETRSLLIPLEHITPTKDEMPLLQAVLARLVAHGLLILEIPQ
jgi:hypothetical protein